MRPGQLETQYNVLHSFKLKISDAKWACLIEVGMVMDNSACNLIVKAPLIFQNPGSATGQ